MSLIRVHNNWPDWFIKYVESEIAKSDDGKFVVKVPSRRDKFGKELGEAFTLKIDEDLLNLTEKD